LCVVPAKHVVPHAKSKLLGEGTEHPRGHERVIGVETDGDEETTPHKPTLVGVER